MTVGLDSAYADPPSASTLQPATAQPVQLPPPPPVQPETNVSVVDPQPQVHPPSQSTVMTTNLPAPPPLSTSNASLTPLEQALAKMLEDTETMIKRIPGVPTPLRKSQPYNYTDSPFIDVLALVKMPRKFSFPNIKLYDSRSEERHPKRPFQLADQCTNSRYSNSYSTPQKASTRDT